MFKRTSRVIGISCRLSYCKLYHPEAIKVGGNRNPSAHADAVKKYSTAILVDENDVDFITGEPALQALQRLQQEVAMESWPDGVYPTNFHPVIRKADKPKEADISNYHIIQAYANEDSPPRILQQNPFAGQSGQPNVIDLSEEQNRTYQGIYSGARAMVHIGVFSYHNSDSDGGLGAGLNYVLATFQGGDRLDGHTSIETAFGSGPIKGVNTAPEASSEQTPFGAASAAPPAGQPQGQPQQFGQPQSQPQQFGQPQGQPQQLGQPQSQPQQFGQPQGQPQQFRQPQSQPQQFGQPQGQPQQFRQPQSQPQQFGQPQSQPQQFGQPQGQPQQAPGQPTNPWQGNQDPNGGIPS